MVLGSRDTVIPWQGRETKLKNQRVIKRTLIRFWGAILCAAVSANVFALSMGDVRVQSFLSQRLELQIPLGNVDP